MVRLLDRVRTSPSEPELFAGLVHACRYCGLLDASEAADERARRLDPHIVTSIAQTFVLKRDWARAIAADTSSTPIAKVLALVYSGNRAEAAAVLRGLIARGLPQSLQALLEGLLDFAEGDGARLLSAIHRLVDSQVGSDPEAMSPLVRLVVRIRRSRRCAGIARTLARRRLLFGVDPRQRSALRSGARVRRLSIAGAAGRGTAEARRREFPGGGWTATVRPFFLITSSTFHGWVIFRSREGKPRPREPPDPRNFPRKSTPFSVARSAPQPAWNGRVDSPAGNDEYPPDCFHRPPGSSFSCCSPSRSRRAPPRILPSRLRRRRAAA